MTSASTDVLIRQAIRERRLLQFDYHGAQRVAEPQDYGILGGRVRLFTWQVRGRSRGPIPGWRLVDVDDLSKVVVLAETFPGSRRQPGQRHKTWDEIFCRVD